MERLDTKRLNRYGRIQHMERNDIDHGGIEGRDAEGLDAEGRVIGSGSLSRLLDTSPTAQNMPPEPDAAQPLIFAAIAVIVGILIL